MNKFQCDARGSALVNVLIVIAALAILGLALSRMSTNRLLELRRSGAQRQAEAAAESGVEEALYLISRNAEWYADGGETMPYLVRELGNWGYEVSVVPVMGGNVYRVRSVGKTNSMEQIAEKTVVITSPLRYTLYALEDITIGAGVQVSGPVYAGGKIDGFLPHTAVEDTFPKEIHSWTMPEIKDYLALRPDRIANGYFRDYRIENRFLLKQGPLTLRDGLLRATSLLVDGVLTIEGRVQATAKEQLPLFVVDGDILLNLDGRSRLTGVILCTGKCTIRGNGEIDGVIIAQEIELGGTTVVSNEGVDGVFIGTTPKIWVY